MKYFVRLGWLGMIALAVATPLAAPAVDLIQAEVNSGGERVLEDAGSTIRLEAPRLTAIERRTFAVPEPGALLQLGVGIGAIALLQILQRRRAG